MSTSPLGLSPAAPEYRALHRTIGQPLSQPLSPYSPSHGLHTPPSPADYLSYGASQPRTPGTGATANVELEVSDLLARATKHAADKKATLTTGEAHLSSYMKAMEALKLDPGAAYSPVRTLALSPAPAVASAPVSAFGPGVIGQGLASAPMRANMEDIWSDPVSAPATGRTGNDLLAPIGTRTAFAPFDASASVPTYGKPQPVHPGTEVAGAVQAHLNALSGLIGGLVGERDEVDRLRKEVDMLRLAKQKVESENAEIKELLEQRNNRLGVGRFVAVLIDGDRLNFQDTFLQAGYQGGHEAARAVTDAVKASSPAVSRVLVTVFVNKAGLQAGLVRSGSVPSAAVFDSFLAGFADEGDLVSIVDVGTRKDACQAKVQGFLDLYSSNTQCEAIVLSEGMAEMKISSPSHLVPPISFLTASEHPGESAQLIYAPALFRLATDIVPTTAHMQSFSAALQSVPAPSAATKRDVPDQAQSPVSEASVPSLVPTKSSSEDSVEVIEWENVNKPMKKDKSVKKQQRKDKREAVVTTARRENAEKADGDEWVEAGKAKVGKRWKGKGGKQVSSVRTLNPRPCHTYYLSPWGCRAKDDCGYSHEYDLTETQTEELARLAKEIICPYIRNNKCHFSEEECVYGHKCPRGASCTFGETCRFSVLRGAHTE